MLKLNQPDMSAQEKQEELERYFFQIQDQDPETFLRELAQLQVTEQMRYQYLVYEGLERRCDPYFNAALHLIFEKIFSLDKSYSPLVKQSVEALLYNIYLVEKEHDLTKYSETNTEYENDSFGVEFMNTLYSSKDYIKKKTTVSDKKKFISRMRDLIPNNPTQDYKILNSVNNINVGLAQEDLKTLNNFISLLSKVGYKHFSWPAPSQRETQARQEDRQQLLFEFQRAMDEFQLEREESSTPATESSSSVTLLS